MSLSEQEPLNQLHRATPTPTHAALLFRIKGLTTAINLALATDLMSKDREALKYEQGHLDAFRICLETEYTSKAFLASLDAYLDNTSEEIIEMHTGLSSVECKEYLQ